MIYLKIIKCIVFSSIALIAYANQIHSGVYVSWRTPTIHVCQDNASQQILSVTVFPRVLFQWVTLDKIER